MDELNDTGDAEYLRSTFRRTAPPARRPPTQGGQRDSTDEMLWLLTRLLDETRSAAVAEQAARAEQLRLLGAIAAALAHLQVVGSAQRDLLGSIQGQLSTLMQAAQVLAHATVVPPVPPATPPSPTPGRVGPRRSPR